VESQLSALIRHVRLQKCDVGALVKPASATTRPFVVCKNEKFSFSEILIII